MSERRRPKQEIPCSFSNKNAEKQIFVHRLCSPHPFLLYSLWLSPHLPRLPSSASNEDGESITGFKRDLLNYLSRYDERMIDWKLIISRADFSSVRVFFVASVPGSFRDKQAKSSWGLNRLASVLKSHVRVRFLSIY